MDIKPRPNHRLYLKILSQMSPEEKLDKVSELNELGRQLFWQGLKQRFPDKTDEDLHRLFLQRIAKCYNRNY